MRRIFVFLPKEDTLSQRSNMKLYFKCPVCGELLTGEKTLACKNNHCFDVARQGYVNLLRSNQASGKRHGDDALMVKARTAFLGRGYYSCLLDGITEQLDEFLGERAVIADLGCGECWYTSKIYSHLTESGRDTGIYGIDISKTALISGAKRCRELNLAVGSIAALPIPDGSCNAVLSVFAPYNAAEVLRITEPGGYFIKVVPLERHLIELKSVIYDNPYENKAELENLPGFELVMQTRVEKKLLIDSAEDISNLFKMTPYYYKTGRDDQQKINSLTSLETTAQFLIETFVKVKN